LVERYVRDVEAVGSNPTSPIWKFQSEPYRVSDKDLILGLLTHRIGLSPIVGYLLAGIVVGRYTPGFVADAELADQLAEIGVILLMFGVGLQFHLDELLAVKGVAVPGAIVQIAAATGLGM
jgi:monovalent cation:H+ antiporter-2, CPA2 family